MCRGVLLERMLVDLAVVLHQSSGDVLQVCPRNVGGAVTDNDRYSRNRGVSTPCRLAEEAFRQGENETYCMTQVVGGDEIDDLFASKKSADNRPFQISRMIENPNKTSTIPPMTPITRTTTTFFRTNENPSRINRTISISSRACPTMTHNPVK